MPHLILGIESSCDETAAAVVEDSHVVRSSIIASQHDLHARYGGVVPEIASRAHIERISPVIEQALAQANVSFTELDAVAVGNRPGLIGSLLVGLSAAKAIAWALGKPLVGVDHIHAHLHAAALRTPSEIRNQTASTAGFAAQSEIRNSLYPALGLVVSGGHTSLYALESPTQLTLLGRTIDDAVGEAYDKAAVILQLGYPGGPKLDQLAQTGDARAYTLPRSMLESGSLDFSFSGLKTALLYQVRGKPQGRGEQAYFEKSADDLTEPQRRDLAASFQAAAIDTLFRKLERAIESMAEQGRPPACVIIGGGVSANSLLRRRAAELAARRSLPVHIPALAYCLDNAAMIAGLAHEYFMQGRFDALDLPALATTGR